MREDSAYHPEHRSDLPTPNKEKERLGIEFKACNLRPERRECNHILLHGQDASTCRKEDAVGRVSEEMSIS